MVASFRKIVYKIWGSDSGIIITGFLNTGSFLVDKKGNSGSTANFLPMPLMLKGTKREIHLLFGLFYEKVRAAAFFIIHDNDVASDIAQETFATALERLDQLKDPAKVESWLVRVAVNKAKNYLRNNKRVVPLTKSIAAADNVQDQVAHKEDKEMLYAAIRQLPGHYQVAIYLRYIRGKSVKEIARTLGVPEGTVKARLKRGRDTLRCNYQERWDEADDGAK